MPDDPVLNGRALSLIFGILVRTTLTLEVVPVPHRVACRH